MVTTASPSARSTVFAAARAGLARPPAMSVSEWAAAHRRIVAQEAAEPGRWRNERTPYLRGVMDAFNDPRVNRISLMKAERVGGSEAILNILGYIIDRAPGPVLYIYPDETTAYEVNRKRVLPTIKRTPALAAHLTDRKWDARLLDLQLDRMSIAFRGSNSEAKLEALAFKYVIVDELDRCAPNVLDIVHGRGATFPGFKLIDISTPELEWSGDPEDRTQGIDRSYKEGDRRRLFVPCPRCGMYHTRTFHQVKWIGDLATHPDTVKAQAYMICPNPRCGEFIHGHHNPGQLQECVWVPHGWTAGPGGVVMPPPELAQTIAPVKAAGGGWFYAGASHASFALHGLNTPFKENPYGYLGAEFVRNRGAVTREFINRRCGEGWSTKGERIETSELDGLKGYVEGAGHGAQGTDLSTPRTSEPCALSPVPSSRGVEWTIGTMPSDAAFLMAFADVQGDCLWVEVAAFDAACERIWLVDHLRVEREIGDGLEHLEAVALREWPVVDLATGEEIRRQPISVLGVDSGHYSDEVYEFVRGRQNGLWGTVDAGDKVRRAGAVCVATKGEPGMHGPRAAQAFRRTWPERDIITDGPAAGSPREDAVSLVLINTWHYKRILFDTLNVELARARRVKREAMLAAARAAGRALSPEEIGAEEATPLGGVGGMASDTIAKHSGSGSRKWFFPDDTKREYFEQLTAEEMKTRLVKGVRVREWATRPGRTRKNHFLDCRVGVLCLVEAMRMAERMKLRGKK